MQGNRLKIVFVDDHPLVMEGLKMILQKDEKLEIVGLFVNGQSALDFLKVNEVDIVLLDIHLPDINGLDLCKEIKGKKNDIKVLMVSNLAERGIIMTAKQNGADGYLLKNTSIQELREAIMDTLNGKFVFSKEVNDILFSPAPNDPHTLLQLTKREKEVLELIADGKTSNQIADELFLSPLTIDTHRKNLMQKFGVKNTAELIRQAVQQQYL